MISKGSKLVIVFIGACLFASLAYADKSASDTVEQVVERVRKTVISEQDRMTPEKLDRKLHSILVEVFDFQTMARSSLAKHWKTASEKERKEFVELFSDLLAKTYLRRIRDNVASSEIRIVGEKSRGATKAIVETKVDYAKEQTASIDYRMREKNGSWLVYDVIIENIGLVSNYRQEFAPIVKNEKVDGLIKRLREKKNKILDS